MVGQPLTTEQATAYLMHRHGQSGGASVVPLYGGRLGIKDGGSFKAVVAVDDGAYFAAGQFDSILIEFVDPATCDAIIREARAPTQSDADIETAGVCVRCGEWAWDEHLKSGVCQDCRDGAYDEWR